jgi:gliding motility-associated-like protein
MKKTLLFLISVFTMHAAGAQLVADFTASSTTLDCNSQCINFTDLTTGGTPVLWQWSFPGAVPASSSAQHPTNICYAVDGFYDVTLIVSDGIDTDTLTQTAYIVKESIPGATVSPDVAIPFSATTVLTATGGTTYAWLPVTGLDDPASPTPVASPSNTTTYTVTITDDATGCSTVLEVTVFVLKDNNVFIPTAFSPNSDGYNEVLYLRGNNFQSVLFSVYDRWGKKVFETNDESRGWDGNLDGEKAVAGVYTYVVVLTYADGFQQTIKGQTALVR